MWFCAEVRLCSIFASAAFALVHRWRRTGIYEGRGLRRHRDATWAPSPRCHKSTAIVFQLWALIVIFRMVSFVSPPVCEDAVSSKRAAQNRQGEAARHAQTSKCNGHLPKAARRESHQLVTCSSGPATLAGRSCLHGYVGSVLLARASRLRGNGRWTYVVSQP